MVEVKLILKGARSNVIVKGNNFTEVLKEYIDNKQDIDEMLGSVAAMQTETKKAPSISAGTIQGRISFLAREGFFEVSKSANEVKDRLRDKGYAYPIDRISIALIRLVRKRELRRLMEKRDGKEVYVYVNP
jgi:hypothetical protein